MKAEKVVFTRICNGGNPLTYKFKKMTCHQNQRPFSCLKTVVLAKPTLFRGYRFRLKLGVLGAILENGKEFDHF